MTKADKKLNENSTEIAISKAENYEDLKNNHKVIANKMNENENKTVNEKQEESPMALNISNKSILAFF